MVTIEETQEDPSTKWISVQLNPNPGEMNPSPARPRAGEPDPNGNSQHLPEVDKHKKILKTSHSGLILFKLKI